MTIKEIIVITVYGNYERTQEVTKQVSDYAQSLPGVAVKVEPASQTKLKVA